ncbi:NAD-dependent epimerase/dehydratase family protein [Candidatus Woesearchaeota archaeon]|nr:NAD-dependent epimerase/dehydratase family protein [Candidatus Woesearchaeota archaeon]
MKVLVTGSGGLIGFETVAFFLKKDVEVIGIDNNMRRYFFGEKGDTTGNIQFLKGLNKKFTNLNLDIRDREKIMKVFTEKGPFDLVVHTAAQPSHDWAAKEPFTDFDVNAVGTLNLLEAFRLHSSKGVFIFTSTNKVYGDTPNKVKLLELEKRYKYDEHQTMNGVSTEGISEEMTLDDNTHSIFGASKAAADIMAQEYGRYFKLNVGIFRGGCLTGPQHSAVELHGFLAYIVDCAINNKPYTIFGYKGKQVRDQIHSKDVVSLFYEFYKNPKQGIAYNLGGGKENSASILEVIDVLENDFRLKLKYTLSDQNRIGDHLCYYSDLTKLKKDYPNWKITISIKDMIKEMIEWRTK